MIRLDINKARQGFIQTEQLDRYEDIKEVKYFNVEAGEDHFSMSYIIS